MELSKEKHKVLREQGDLPMINFIAQEVRHSLVVLYKPMYIIVDTNHSYMLNEEISNFMSMGALGRDEISGLQKINVLDHWLFVLERPEHAGINVLSTSE